MKKSEITQTGLFRMSFILQDSSATTTSTYLLKIIEYMLYTANDYLSIPEISDRIQIDLSLEFSDLEIINAINNSPQIVQRGKKYALTPQRLNTLSSMESIETKLISFIRHFIRLSPEITFDEKSFFNLFSRFLYYCFNENKEALLMIIDGNERITDRTHFEASKEECDIINRFLSWENIDKDKLIYQVVSSCYAYCSLTVKKDTLFSQRIFRSKKFFLDANIIFRMAGINRAERQRSVSSFIKICNTLKIQLIYTNSTFSEINRVINNKCKWLQSIAGNTAPLDLSLWEHQEDDFYELYRKWCREPGNRCGDFLAFNNYVQRQVDDVLGRLKQVTIPNYLLRDGQEFNNSCNVLATYKKRHYTRQSLETDINNLMYLVDQRKGEKAENIFSTSTFMISADQNFIAYANDIYDGVQLVVLPSVWLTIMLRFCGRTDDDYKAFVSFMNIRTSEEVIWDIYGILSRLNCYTSDEEVKRRVITEMQQHRDLYPVQDEEECDVSIEKAFDTVVARVKDEHKQALAEETKNLEYDFLEKMQQQKNETEKHIEEINHQHSMDRQKLLEINNAEKKEAIIKAQETSTTNERKRNATTIATIKVDKQLRLWKLLNNIRKIATFVFVVIAVGVFLGWLYGYEPIEQLVEKYIPQRIAQSIDSQINFMTVCIWGVLAAALKLLKRANEKMFSEERRTELIKKETGRILFELNKRSDSSQAAA